ncbi:histidine ammonia-lyase [Bradymonas sediminis]|uniref:Histidine ammonia-lyase n=1 Tax=Bradymonas sediminis TaxID=1548548 RepID=A0A2Z4FPA0_9DELT|nr:histidine ammonia-lyase [Bradymonas sediminis]AWV90783.1 histidine ammonia-lyase [Bradymonas sediminis]TDP75483.1 histidine ammonia-lyase [Bradymonas sediminis]
MEIGHTLLTLETIESVVVDRKEVQLAESAHAKINEAARFVREMAHSGKVVYGVTTGFGANRNHVIRPEDAETLQERLIVSHACGVGAPLSTEVVRAMMLLRVNALAQGDSGIRLSTLQVLVDMLNRGVHPIVPEMGSVGASGDLCPLAHMCLPILGYGEAEYKGEVMSGEEAMRAAGLSTVRLTYKEGLALLNGTQAMTAAGVIAAIYFRRLLDCADTVGAMSFDAVGGRLAALDARIHELRRRPGQIHSARVVRRLLKGSELAGAQPGSIEGKVEYVQDSYCLRCMPQVHGASRDVLDHVIEVLTTEANAVTDNPLVFPPKDGEPGAILSGGNFHGQPVAMALDYLKIAIAEIGSISERRSAKLTDKYFSEGLPPFLVTNPGLNSGMMIPQYVAAALVSENKTRSFPASVDSIPTSANMEDHVSMGMHAAMHALRALENVERIVGIEYLIAAQGLDLREGYQLGEGTARALAHLREHVSFLQHDRVMYPDINKAADLIHDGSLAETMAAFFAPVD